MSHRGGRVSRAPEQVIDWVSTHVNTSTEAVFIVGNGFRAAHTIEELERRTGQLVLEANPSVALVDPGRDRDHAPGRRLRETVRSR
jgi:maleate cis-trans isomerase